MIRIRSVKQLGPLAPLAMAGVDRPPARRAPRPPRLGPVSPQGTVIARFVVDGDPVPWRAPLHGAGGVIYTPEHVKAWKEAVALAAQAAGFGESVGQPLYRAPVAMVVYACRKAPRRRKAGDRWDARPDADNLFKGLGDAVSGNVFKAAGIDPATGRELPARLMPPSPVGRILADDNLITDVVVHKRYWTHSFAYIKIIAMARHDPGPYPFPE